MIVTELQSSVCLKFSIFYTVYFDRILPFPQLFQDPIHLPTHSTSCSLSLSKEKYQNKKKANNIKKSKQSTHEMDSVLCWSTTGHEACPVILHCHWLPLFHQVSNANASCVGLGPYVFFPSLCCGFVWFEPVQVSLCAFVHLSCCV